MIYKKPYNLSYCDMCILIDNDELSDELKFQYLYHIAYMLIKSMKRFEYNSYLYEEFAIYFASKLFLRTTLEPKIISILNYMKSTITYNIIQFEESNKTYLVTEEAESYRSEYTLKNLMQNSTNLLYVVEMKVTLSQLCKTIKSFLATRLPKGYFTSNIYLSVMLSILNSLCLSDHEIKWSEGLVREGCRENLLQSLYEKEAEKVILYKLDSSYENLVKTLVKEVKHKIAMDLSYTSNTEVNSDFLLSMAFSGGETDV